MLKFLKKIVNEQAMQKIELLENNNDCLIRTNTLFSEQVQQESEIIKQLKAVNSHLQEQAECVQARADELQLTLDKRMDDVETRIKASSDSSLKYKLEEAANKCEVKIKKVMKMDLEQLKEYTHFYVNPVLKDDQEAEELNDEEFDALVKQASEEGKVSWTVYHNICSLGGCDFHGEVFPNEIEAYRAAAILTAIHDHPDSSSACSSCYAEYMQDCI